MDVTTCEGGVTACQPGPGQHTRVGLVLATVAANHTMEELFARLFDTRLLRVGPVSCALGGADGGVRDARPLDYAVDLCIRLRKAVQSFSVRAIHLVIWLLQHDERGAVHADQVSHGLTSMHYTLLHRYSRHVNATADNMAGARGENCPANVVDAGIDTEHCGDVSLRGCHFGLIVIPF